VCTPPSGVCAKHVMERHDRGDRRALTCERRPPFNGLGRGSPGAGTTKNSDSLLPMRLPIDPVGRLLDFQHRAPNVRQPRSKRPTYARSPVRSKGRVDPAVAEAPKERAPKRSTVTGPAGDGWRRSGATFQGQGVTHRPRRRPKGVRHANAGWLISAACPTPPTAQPCAVPPLFDGTTSFF
jgi:hypothetical protein